MYSTFDSSIIFIIFCSPSILLNRKVFFLQSAVPYHDLEAGDLESTSWMKEFAVIVIVSVSHLVGQYRVQCRRMYSHQSLILLLSQQLHVRCSQGNYYCSTRLFILSVLRRLEMAFKLQYAPQSPTNIACKIELCEGTDMGIAP